VFAPLRIAGLRMMNLQRSRAYDLVMRLPLLGWSVFCAMIQVASLNQYIHDASAPPTCPACTVKIAMMASTIGSLLFLAAAVILRARPIGKANGVEPRISAFVGTFLVYAIPLFPRSAGTVASEMASTALILIGSSAAAFALLHLRASFSMMAEARRLVTSGPYRYVRHPLYLAEEVAICGLVLQFCSIWTAIIFVFQIAFQLRRMHNEEAVLSKILPEYAAYRKITARLIPGIY
jgi:protein-S-isoprenylcysteine O-methyltransferase Ste14